MTDQDTPSLPVARLTYDGPRGPLFKALAEARKHFGNLAASATADVRISQAKGGGSYQFSYAPLDVVLEALEPGLQKAGLALLQPFDGGMLYTILAFEESSVTVATSLPAWSTPQELGSLLTYLRRYQLKGIFGVADSEDDDGNAASGNKATIARKEPKAAPPANGLSQATKDEITGKAKELEMPGNVFHARCKEVTGKSWADLTEADGKKFLAALVLKS